MIVALRTRYHLAWAARNNSPRRDRVDAALVRNRVLPEPDEQQRPGLDPRLGRQS